MDVPGVGGVIEPVTADINSDGLDEVLVAADNTLTVVAYHEINGGEVLWKEIFPADIGASAIAEMDGKMQIVVVCQDGYSYGLGPADNRPVLKSDVATAIRGMEPQLLSVCRSADLRKPKKAVYIYSKMKWTGLSKYIERDLCQY